jgi:hypothetical protein
MIFDSRDNARTAIKKLGIETIVDNPGLPDFSWFNVPKREKILKIHKIHKIYQNTKYHMTRTDKKMYNSKYFQIYQNWDFWYANIPPSGNPDMTSDDSHLRLRAYSCKHFNVV